MNRISRCDTRAGKMELELSCPLGIRALSRKENLSCFTCFIPYNKSSIDQACSVSRWLDIGLFLGVYGPRLRRGPYTRKKKELGQYPAILAERLVNSPYALGKPRAGHFLNV